MNKTNTDGIKLYSGGQEITKEQAEQAISEYEKKIASPAFQKELKEFEAFIAASRKNSAERLISK